MPKNFTGLWSANKMMCGLPKLNSLCLLKSASHKMANHHHHHSHNHSTCSSDEIGETYSLYKSNELFFCISVRFFSWNFAFFRHIDTELLKCLNESDHGSIKKIFKPWDKRLDKTTVKISIRLKVNYWYSKHSLKLL
jgi:hypothetical protein